MSTETRKGQLLAGTALDGFEGYEDAVEGQEEHRQSLGRLLKFTNQATWEFQDGEEVPADFEAVVVDIQRRVVKWPVEQGPPLEVITLAPGEKFPDVEKMNEACPREEWRTDMNGNPKGPWDAQHVIVMINFDTMTHYFFPTATTGGHIASSELAKAVKWRRRLVGAAVYPIVKLADTYMPAGYGGRQRPNFAIQRWISFGGDTAALPAPSAGVAAALDNFAQADEAKTAEPEKKPTVGEEMGDSIPSKGAVSTTDRASGSRGPINNKKKTKAA
jgi:hypothetical protein